MNLGILDSILQRIDLMLILFMRTLGLFVSAPIWSNRLIPTQMRIALAFGTAVIVSPLFKQQSLPDTLVSMAALAIQEILVGLIIGFVASLIMSGIQLAGQLLDSHMGLAMMNVLDPMTNTQMPILGNLLYLLALLIFFLLNGHHALLQAVMDSYALIPIGQAVFTAKASWTVLGMAGKIFMIGLKIASPVVAAVFLITIALGILNRAMPQMNVFVVGLPVQMGVGFFMLMVVLPLYVTFLHVVFRGEFEDILTVLRLLRG